MAGKSKLYDLAKSKLYDLRMMYCYTMYETETDAALYTTARQRIANIKWDPNNLFVNFYM